jgi:hypothetical protein
MVGVLKICEGVSCFFSKSKEVGSTICDIIGKLNWTLGFETFMKKSHLNHVLKGGIRVNYVNKVHDFWFMGGKQLLVKWKVDKCGTYQA